jgi:hypothetical protein
VGLIQKAVENAGIATVSLTHLPDLTKKVMPPRALHIKLPLGQSFGAVGRRDLQRKILLNMLDAIVTMKGDEMIKELPYTTKSVPNFIKIQINSNKK